MTTTTTTTAREIAALRREMNSCAVYCLNTVQTIAAAYKELDEAMDNMILALNDMQYAVNETNEALNDESGIEELCNLVYCEIERVKENLEDDSNGIHWRAEREIKALLKNKYYKMLRDDLEVLETVY